MGMSHAFLNNLLNSSSFSQLLKNLKGVEPFSFCVSFINRLAWSLIVPSSSRGRARGHLVIHWGFPRALSNLDFVCCGPVLFDQVNSSLIAWSSVNPSIAFSNSVAPALSCQSPRFQLSRTGDGFH